MNKYQWWQTAVGYQIYPRSFQDSNGDGIGDLAGIRQRLPYLKELGVDFLWLNPIYASPNFDNGYDISDFYALHPDFGTLEELKQLLKEAHQLGLKIILDLVLNHTSDQHPWFQEAKKSRDNPYRTYYHWHDATPTAAPNDWQSFFGGSTWTYDPATEQSYFHIFAKEQPDLNWTNPKMRAEMYQMIRWWLALGIDGFRLDAISHLQKAPWEVSIATTETPWVPFMNVAGIEEYLAELTTIFKEAEVFTVGEASGVSATEAVKWSGPAGYFDVIFELEHTKRIGAAGHQTGDLAHLRTTLYRWQEALADQGWNALYLENHDTPRSISVFGNNQPEAAKGLALLLLTLRGTPFIYQGQEIGMTNFPFTDPTQLNATDTLALYQQLQQDGLDAEAAFQQAINWSRDHSRTPMQWDATPFAGFSQTASWLPVHPDFPQHNVVSEEAAADSLLAFYQDLLALRKKEPGLVTGRFHALDQTVPGLFYYTKTDSAQQQEWLIAINLNTVAQELSLPTKWIPTETSIHLKSATTKVDWPAKKIILAPNGYLLARNSS